MNIPDGFKSIQLHQYLALLTPATKPDGTPIDLSKSDIIAVVEDVLSVTSSEAVEKIRDLERSGLLTFAVAPDGDPAVFIAPDDEFTNTEDLMAAQSLLRFFDTTGAYDSHTTEMIISVASWATKSADPIRHICEDLHISPRTLLDAMQRFHENGWLKILSDGKGGCYVRFAANKKEGLSPSDIRIVEAFHRLYGKINNSNIPLLAPVKVFTTSEYMRAVEAQYSMLAINERVLAEVERPSHAHHHAFKDWSLTSRLLREAETYCWFHDPEVAVQAAAATLPTTFKLGREVIPLQSGFWYFADPIGVPTTTDGRPIKALLWGWESVEYHTEFGLVSRPGLTLEAVIEDQHGVMIPTVRFFWREGLTFEQMVTNQRAEFTIKYSDSPDILERLRLNIDAIEYMGRFFAAGALWLQQRVLTTTPATIERHFRKRMVKQHKTVMKDLVIVQLRRRQSVSEAEPGSSTAVDWKCRWAVTGHWRNQPYKTTGKIEAIWIDSYVKGPDDMPFKQSPKKVFAVKR